MRRVYLDHNASAPLTDEARAQMAAALEVFGNPSSVHAEGRRARDLVEAARREVAQLVGASADEVVFTAGGTEADNAGAIGLGQAARENDPRRRRVLVSPLEHPAVLGACAQLAARGFVIQKLPVTAEGALADFSVGDDVALVAVQLANHELGNLFPVAELAARAHAAGALVHCDAVQAAGKLAVDARALGADALAISAHKLGGPKGVGALILRQQIAPLYAGGHQERERRPGTENLIGIVGFGAAAKVARAGLDERAAQVARLRDRLEAGCLALGARVNGARARVCNTTNLAWEGVEGTLLVESLDLEGVACSTGAACTSGSVEPSPVLLACHQSRGRAVEGVRFSLGPSNTEDEIDRVLAILPALIQRVRIASAST